MNEPSTPDDSSYIHAPYPRHLSCRPQDHNVQPSNAPNPSFQPTSDRPKPHPRRVKATINPKHPTFLLSLSKFRKIKIQLTSPWNTALPCTWSASARNKQFPCPIVGRRKDRGGRAVWIGAGSGLGGV
ncbi:hypothetical protein BDZ97DRAFT_1821041 [Flammula alnicola]|nr:hypothetical protein BDZ97DRAFT_1821041 [Flammula alnicola]